MQRSIACHAKGLLLPSIAHVTAMGVGGCSVTLPAAGLGAYLGADAAGETGQAPEDCSAGCADSGPVAICTGQPNGTPCSDGDPKTAGETCSGGACAGGKPFCDFLVTSLEDSASGSCTAAKCTLRDALIVAINSPQQKVPVIAFAQAGTVALNATLPSITQSVTIDGAAGVASAGKEPRVVLDGGSKFQVFKHRGGVLTVRGLGMRHGAAAFGGAIECNSLEALGLVVEDSSFQDNTATEAGGAIYCDANTMVRRSRFVANRTTKAHNLVHGGAVAGLAQLDVDQCQFEANVSGKFGGAVSGATGGALRVSNSTFVGNLAKAGGGIVSFSQATLANVTLVGNGDESCTAGGGVYLAGSSELRHVTAVNNKAADSQQIHFAITTIANSLIVGTGTAAQCNANSAKVTGSIISDGSCGTKPGGEVKLGELGDHGGPTWTYSLLPGSAAIDMGDATFCQADLGTAVDQRGVARPFGSGCDIGAFEHGPDDCPNGLVGVGGRCLDPATLLFRISDSETVMGNTASLLMAAPGSLVVNGGAEAGEFIGWTKVDGGSGWKRMNGVFDTWGFIGSYEVGWLTQQLSLLDAGLSAAVIDAGKAPPVLVGVTARGTGTAGKHAKPGTEDHVSLRVAPIDANGKVGADLLLIDADCPFHVPLGLHGRIASLPAGTRKLLIAVSDVDTEYQDGPYAADIDGIYLTLGDMELRVANEDLPFGAWQPWPGWIKSYALSPGSGHKKVKIEVRDAATQQPVAAAEDGIDVL